MTLLILAESLHQVSAQVKRQVLALSKVEFFSFRWEASFFTTLLYEHAYGVEIDIHKAFSDRPTPSSLGKVSANIINSLMTRMTLYDSYYS